MWLHRARTSGQMSCSWRSEAKADRLGVYRGEPKRMQKVVRGETLHWRPAETTGKGHSYPYFFIFVTNQLQRILVVDQQGTESCSCL
ncbi:hypothetical protein Y1Q_0021095 [Alligator mississippiensis]|uniref:Uncharacterized protein n=1 Tax=Alligator mississippiensis TaxID=8496 RepID=A0A151NRI1_ALLMI|nr:hypothetical protein Y1Q_0021095 [Alligator mississippiensis]